MKNLRIALFGLMVLAVATLGTSFSASAQTTKYAVFNSVTNVPNGTTNSTLYNLLGDDTKWNATQSTNPSFSGSTNVAAIQIDIASGDPVPDIDGTSKVNFYTALLNFYVANGKIFPTSSSFQITATTDGSDHTYTIRVQLKN